MTHFYTIHPNGKFWVYSTIVDNFIAGNLTRKELIQWVIDENVKEITGEMNDVCDFLEGKTKCIPKRNILSYDNAVNLIRGE